MSTSIPPALIDPHVHIWDLAQFHLPWMEGVPESIKRNFGPDDFVRDTSDLNVERALYMEVDVDPSQQSEEVQFAIELCQSPSNHFVAAVVGGSLLADDFRAYVDRFAGQNAIKGVRTVLHTPERPAGYCLQPKFVDSIRYLGDQGLSFDLCMRRAEIRDAAKLARESPQTLFILDHCGGISGAAHDADTMEDWKQGIATVAGQENIVCKISGIVDPGLGQNWSADQLSERVNVCLDAFGPDRVMFAGDWPVLLMGGSYHQWVEALSTIVADRDEEFRQKLFYDNALRIYRMN